MSNIIYYTTTNSQPIILYNSDALGSEIISNTYENGKGAIVCKDNIDTIGEWAFSGCSRLITINIPDGVTTIEKGAFSGCIRMTTVNIPDSVTTIQNGAFYGCIRMTCLLYTSPSPRDA